VTGQIVPLDPAFYEAVEALQGDPGQGGGAALPFADHDGEFVSVEGILDAQEDLPVDLDVRVPDASAEGGVDAKGKLLLEGPGPFTLMVPRGLGELELQAFQDLTTDGPTPDDPYGELSVIVGDQDLAGLSISLVEGARGEAGSGEGPEHVEMPPGAPGGSGEGGGGSGSIPTQPDPFEAYPGPRVTIRGQVLWQGEGVVDLDLFKPDSHAPGGRDLIGKIKLNLGDYEFQVPAGFGPLELEAFVDVAGDGPSATDPSAAYEGNPLLVSTTDLDGVDFELGAGARVEPDPEGAGAADGGSAGSPPEGRPDEPEPAPPGDPSAPAPAPGGAGVPVGGHGGSELPPEARDEVPTVPEAPP
jgi:hypothetical protein